MDKREDGYTTYEFIRVIELKYIIYCLFLIIINFIEEDKLDLIKLYKLTRSHGNMSAGRQVGRSTGRQADKSGRQVDKSTGRQVGKCKDTWEHR